MPRDSASPQSVALTRDFRLLQRPGGHGYSVDDLLVAHLACTKGGPAPSRVLDLGCGVGSVLLMVGWAFRDAELVGIEAQAESAALARRNLEDNGCAARGRIVEGDLRDPAMLADAGAFDLVTGSPPYFDPRASTVSKDEQRAYARWELRGGIEDYARAAARALSPGGAFVACAATDPPGRATAALGAAGLSIAWRRDVVPHPARPAFLVLLVAVRDAPAPTVEAPPLLLRNADGTRTDDHRAIREHFGIECGPF